MQKTKELQLEDTRYQLRKMDARTGCWVAVQVASYVLPSAMEQQLDAHGIIVPNQASKRQMSEAEFRNIQDHCLSAVFYYLGNDSVPLPILHGSGRFALPELEADSVLILMLTAHSLMFNLQGFFAEGRLEKLMESFQNGTQSFTEASFFAR